MLKISEIRGKYLANRYLPRFFLLIFCTFKMQNMIPKKGQMFPENLGMFPENQCLFTKNNRVLDFSNKIGTHFE